MKLSALCVLLLAASLTAQTSQKDKDKEKDKDKQKPEMITLSGCIVRGEHTPGQWRQITVKTDKRPVIYFDRKNDLYLYTTDKEDTMKRIIMSLATLVATAFLAVQPALALSSCPNSR